MRKKNQTRNLIKDRRLAYSWSVRFIDRNRTINRAALEKFLMHDASAAFIATFHRAIRTPHQSDVNVLNLLVTAMGQQPAQALGKAA